MWHRESCYHEHRAHHEEDHPHPEHPWPPRPHPWGPGWFPPEGCCAPAAPWPMGMPFFRRRFWTKEERIAHLERYLEALRAEAQAVEERLAELKGK